MIERVKSDPCPGQPPTSLSLKRSMTSISATWTARIFYSVLPSRIFAIQQNSTGIKRTSLTGHFRAEYVGRGALAERQQKLNKHLHQLQRLADAFNIAIYITNQVMADPSVLFGDPTRAVGGHILSHMSYIRLYLSFKRFSLFWIFFFFFFKQKTAYEMLM